MVLYPIDTVDWHRLHVLLNILLLSHSMATALCTTHQIKGSVIAQILSWALLTVCSAFSPHEAHAHQAFFGWILPTIRISEYTVLQIVGLDAAVVRDDRSSPISLELT